MLRTGKGSRVAPAACVQISAQEGSDHNAAGPEVELKAPSQLGLWCQPLRTGGFHSCSDEPNN